MTANARRLTLACLLGALFSPTAPVLSAVPSTFREQVEADWLRQDEKRLSAPSAVSSHVPREADAAGGVDGRKDGKWGFHTENEKDPWWQVDLGRSFPLERVVLYNRCEPGMAERNGRVLVLASEDGKTFKQVYQHDGTVFYGFTDKKPLTVRLNGVQGRYLRLALTGTSYFHLDEVEIFPAGKEENIALGQPATQSSVSQWSVAHTKTAPQDARDYPMATVQERGLKLAASQERLGAKVEPQRRGPETGRGSVGPAPDERVRRGQARALFPGALGGARDGAGQSAPLTRLHPVRQARPRHVPAHVATSTTAGGRGPAAASICWRASSPASRGSAA